MSSSSSGPQEPSAITDHSAKFMITVNASTMPGGKADMVWIVDNSGSMSEEAALVRDNLENFANYLQNQVQARMLVISRAGTSGTSLSIPANSSQFEQIDHEVGSRNSTSILVGLMGGHSSDRVSTEEQQTFQNFFRSDARKIFVYVTDDDSQMSSADFESVLTSYFLGESVTQFGFVSFESRAVSPCMANFGSVYAQLAQDSGGDVFNICDSDWSQNFSKLAQSIQKIYVNNQFNLSNASLIIDVRLNGQPLSISDYSFVNGVLTISRSVIDVNRPTSEVDVTFD